MHTPSHAGGTKSYRMRCGSRARSPHRPRRCYSSPTLACPCTAPRCACECVRVHGCEHACMRDWMDRANASSNSPDPTRTDESTTWRATASKSNALTMWSRGGRSAALPPAPASTGTARSGLPAVCSAAGGALCQQGEDGGGMRDGHGTARRQRWGRRDRPSDRAQHQVANAQLRCNVLGVPGSIESRRCVAPCAQGLHERRMAGTHWICRG